MTPDDANPTRVQEKIDIQLLLHSRLVRDRLTADPKSNAFDHFESAIKDLDREGVLKMSNYQLRSRLQNEINPEIVDILLCFEQAIDKIPNEIDSIHEDVILQDHEDTAARIPHAPKDSPQAAFLARKIGALETLMSYHGWIDSPKLPDWEQHAVSTDEHIRRDDFGYDGSKSEPHVLEGMRFYQTVNMCRSAMIRQQLGYSSIALKSTIHGAGRGVFVDGKCKIGSLLAFVPGEVWPKEHLEKIASDPELLEHFSHNPLTQLFGRGDDIIVDARRAPYTVLDNNNCNPWAIGHIANHPPRGAEINCRKVPINFVERDFQDLMRFVPNTYARKPAILGQGALQLESISMYGMGLMSRMNLCDQELVYNYRLKTYPGQEYKGPPIPDWYHEEFKVMDEPKKEL